MPRSRCPDPRPAPFAAPQPSPDQRTAGTRDLVLPVGQEPTSRQPPVAGHAHAAAALRLGPFP